MSCLLSLKGATHFARLWQVWPLMKQSASYLSNYDYCNKRRKTCQRYGGKVNVTFGSQRSAASQLASWRERFHTWSDWLRDFLYGMTYFEMEKELHKQRSDLESLFVLISFGDLLGVPVLPPYYSMRLLPFVVPLLNSWRRHMLREKDLTDLVG